MSVLEQADVVVVGPAPPLRGGIAAHTARLVEAFAQGGRSAAAASFRRLYPGLMFPGRRQRTPAPRPPWCEEVLDTLDPRSWSGLSRRLGRSAATVVLQWWHPVVAPALAMALQGVARERIVAVCHNVLPHERVPGARAAARLVLGLAGRVICHSRFEQEALSRLLGSHTATTAIALPCLVDPGLARRAALPPEIASLPASARVVAVAGHLRSYKAPELLLEAWRGTERPKEAVLAIVGESYLRGREREAVLRASLEDQSILLVDRYVSDEELVSFLASAEALVLSHRSATQSGLLPIARALGLPCIASDAGGLGEQAAAADDLVAAGDAAALAAGLGRRLRLVPHRLADPLRSGSGSAFLEEWRSMVEAIAATGRP